MSEDTEILSSEPVSASADAEADTPSETDHPTTPQDSTAATDVAEDSTSEVTASADEVIAEVTTEEVTTEEAAAKATDEAASVASETESAEAPANTTAAAPEPVAEAAVEKPAAPAVEERPEIAELRAKMAADDDVEGKVIGWNNGGFHVVLAGIAAFCPRSEMEVGKVGDPKQYLDQTLPFRIIKIQQQGKRVVVSRAVAERGHRTSNRREALDRLEIGAVVDGRISSLVDFGAFVDLGGVEGLVHVSQIARRKVDKPSDVLELGQTVRVKILKIENGGNRISLSMKALEPDPWAEFADQFPIGTVAEGTVERTANFGAIVELAPDFTGLLPASTLSIPPDSSIARAYPPGKKLSVQVMSIDPRRRRISLALEGSTQGGTRADYQDYQKRSESGDGFNALADALQKLRPGSD